MCRHSEGEGVANKWESGGGISGLGDHEAGKTKRADLYHSRTCRSVWERFGSGPNKYKIKLILINLTHLVIMAQIPPVGDQIILTKNLCLPFLGLLPHHYFLSDISSSTDRRRCARSKGSQSQNIFHGGFGCCTLTTGRQQSLFDCALLVIRCTCHYRGVLFP